MARAPQIFTTLSKLHTLNVILRILFFPHDVHGSVDELGLFLITDWRDANKMIERTKKLEGMQICSRFAYRHLKIEKSAGIHVYILQK